MKKLLLCVCILTATAYQPAHAREYYRYEPVGHNQPEYIEYDGTHYARVPQEKTFHFTRLTSEQVNNTALKRKIINVNTLSFHPYIGIDGAIGEIKYNNEEDKFLFNKSMKRFGVFGGLQFNQYVGLEAFYNIGSMKEKKHQIAVTEFTDLNTKDTIDFKAYGIDLMGYLPVLDSVDVILGLGYGWYTFDAKLDAGFCNYSVELCRKLGSIKDKTKDEAIRFSLGAQYLINDNWSLRLLGRYADFTDGDAVKSMIEASFGLRYMF